MKHLWRPKWPARAGLTWRLPSQAVLTQLPSFPFEGATGETWATRRWPLEVSLICLRTLLKASSRVGFMQNPVRRLWEAVWQRRSCIRGDSIFMAACLKIICQLSVVAIISGQFGDGPKSVSLSLSDDCRRNQLNDTPEWKRNKTRLEFRQTSNGLGKDARSGLIECFYKYLSSLPWLIRYDLADVIGNLYYFCLPRFDHEKVIWVTIISVY